MEKGGKRNKGKKKKKKDILQLLCKGEENLKGGRDKIFIVASYALYHRHNIE